MNDYLPTFLYRYESGDSTSFGATREVSQHYPKIIIGVALRRVGEPIHMLRFEEFHEFKERVEEHSKEAVWFDEPLDCEGDDD